VSAVMIDALEVIRAMDRTEEQRSVHAALELWARWALSLYAEVGWPRQSIIQKLLEYGRGATYSGGSGQRRVEADERCEAVDKAILRLDETEREVIVRTYLGKADTAQITARACGLTYQYYRQVLSRARQRVGDFLAGSR
jgi:DNA-directed RNA polymerase specialized sigma24 family protein